MPRVLIVDDEPAIRTSLALLFDSASWHVTQAADGLDALNRLARDRFDLLITDIRMPGMDGWSLAESARATQPGLPIIYVTGWSGVAERPVPGGVIVDKPYDVGQLLQLADQLTQRRQVA